jgi:hypothetical protein
MKYEQQPAENIFRKKRKLQLHFPSAYQLLATPGSLAIVQAVAKNSTPPSGVITGD